MFDFRVLVDFAMASPLLYKWFRWCQTPGGYRCSGVAFMAFGVAGVVTGVEPKIRKMENPPNTERLFSGFGLISLSVVGSSSIPG